MLKGKQIMGFTNTTDIPSPSTDRNMSTVSLCSFNMSTVDGDISMDDRRKVVIAMDGSDHAMFALNWYKEHMYKPIDYVYLIHSVEWQHVLHNSKWHYSPQHNNLDTVGPLIKEEQAIIRERLEKFAEDLKRLELDGEVKAVHSKKPGEGVVHEASEVGASLIVTGTRGYGALRRTILGSVSDYIVHHANCPVTVCHDHSKQKHHNS